LVLDLKNQNLREWFSAQFIIPAVFTIILLLSIFAIFSGFNSDPSAELEANRINQRGGRIEQSEWFSVDVVNANSNNARKWDLSSEKQGVIVTDVEGARDVKLKLHKGDVIKGINGKNIKSVRDFRKASRAFDPKAGLFLDIDRYGYPMYVSIPGSDYTSNSQFLQSQTPDSYNIMDVGPAFGSDINIGRFQNPNGALGETIESWINNNFEGKYYTCLNCGTLVPQTNGVKKRNIFCPNCGNRMILK